MAENRNSGLGKFLLFVLTVLLIGSVGGTIYFIYYANYLIGFIFFVSSLIFAYLLIKSISDYNKIIKYKNKINESLALIDIHLKLRFDLIPNLVETVKGYAKHEKDVFKEVTALRSMAATSKSQGKKFEYANMLVPKMRELVIIAEGYPELRSDASFRNLMEQLIIIEDKLVASRRIYDSNVNEYNTLIMVFPTSIIANSFGFKKEVLFKIDAGERIAERIKF